MKRLGHSETWRPGLIASALTENSSWTAAIDEHDLRVDGKSYPVVTIAAAKTRRGMFFADIEIDLCDGESLKLGGLTNRKARLLVDLLTVLPAAAQHRHQFHYWGEGRRWIPQSIVDRFKSESPQHLLGIKLKKSAVRRVARRGRSQLSEKQRRLIEFLAGDRYESEAVSHNKTFLKEELERYRDYFDKVEKNPLTPEQRESVITFDDNVMTVAAAGSGKTSVMVAKAGYAIESGLFKPEEVVLLAFNRDAAKELSDRVKKYLGPRLKDASLISVSTFHSLGLLIIGKATGAKPVVAPWVESGKELSELTNIVETLSKRRSFAANWSLFKTVYATSLPPFGTQEEPDSWDPKTGTRGFRTIRGETVKSREEQLIANWLALKGIEYEYERPYEIDTATSEKGQYHPDFWYPSADVYHEHFGVDKNGNPPDWFKPGYKESMEWKRQLHKKRRTTLIETTSHSIRQPDGIARLQKDLERHGIEFGERPLTSEQQDALTEDTSLLRTFRTFMAHVKSNRLTMDDLRRRSKSKTTEHPERDRLFLKIFEEIWGEWDRRLEGGNYVDFEDMLCKAVDHLAADRCSMPYKLIMADEFQDSSRVRGALLRELSKNQDARLFVVGDDWQAVNRFAGADISLMKNFAKHFGSSTTTQLTTTFRCPEDLCEVAGAFVAKNPFQIEKTVHSANPRTEPSVVCFKLDDIKRQDAVLSKHIRTLAEKLRQQNQKASAYILGRYRTDRPSNLEKMKNDVADVVDLAFSTIHRAKGLEADYIFVVNVIEAVKGMPSKIADDSALWIAMPDGESFPYAEERRLFYVALTRAKKVVSIYTDFLRRSEFIAELERSGSRIQFRQEGEVAEELSNPRKCPQCENGILRSRKGKFGTFIGCSRFPKCDFTENVQKKSKKKKASKKRRSARKCPRCRKGVLIKKDGQFGSFYGCSRYPQCEFTENNEEKCPNCGKGKIIVKKGRNGKFMACDRYPRCKYTRSPRRSKTNRR